MSAISGATTYGDYTNSQYYSQESTNKAFINGVVMPMQQNESALNSEIEQGCDPNGVEQVGYETTNPYDGS